MSGTNKRTIIYLPHINMKLLILTDNINSDDVTIGLPSLEDALFETEERNINGTPIVVSYF